MKLGRSPRVVHLAPCCPSPSPRTIQDTQVSRVLIFPSPFRAPVCPHLPLSVCSLLASLHAPCPSKSADRRSTPRLAGQPLHSTASFPAPIRAPSHCPRPSHRAPVPCCRGLTAHPSDAFACSFSSFHRVRSVSCTILRFLVCALPRVFTPLSVCCISVPSSVSRMSLHLLSSCLIFPVLCGFRGVVPPPSEC